MTEMEGLLGGDAWAAGLLSRLLQARRASEGERERGREERDKERSREREIGRASCRERVCQYV